MNTKPNEKEWRLKKQKIQYLLKKFFVSPPIKNSIRIRFFFLILARKSELNTVLFSRVSFLHIDLLYSDARLFYRLSGILLLILTLLQQLS